MTNLEISIFHEIPAAVVLRPKILATTRGMVDTHFLLRKKNAPPFVLKSCPKDAHVLCLS